MNRPQRKVQQRTSHADVRDYRVPRGWIALTLDLTDADPLTVSTEASKLSEIVAHTAKLVGNWPYQRVLDGRSALHQAYITGRLKDPDGFLVGFWLALNHPIGGAAMRRQLSDKMAAGERCHITMRGSPDGGVGFALADRYVDLRGAAAAVTAAGAGVMTLETPERPRGVVQ